uniref:Tetratricopeptide repeat protein n=1 Tax=Ascaris lumbricoides TaxID=6252 RepID=A0A0M3IV78_ASCLU
MCVEGDFETANAILAEFNRKHPGDFETANAILAEFNRKHPGYAVIPLRRVGIERRMLTLNTPHGATPDYSSVISHFERLIQDPQTPRRLATFYALKLARFHAKTRNDRKLAEKILLDALTRDKDSEQLYLALIDLAYSAPIFDENAVLDALDSALNCEYLSNEEKLRFSQRKLDFLEDLGTDINKYVKYIFKKIKIYMSSDIYESGLKWINCSENFNYNNTVLRKTALTFY